MYTATEGGSQGQPREAQGAVMRSQDSRGKTQGVNPERAAVMRNSRARHKGGRDGVSVLPPLSLSGEHQSREGVYVCFSQIMV